MTQKCFATSERLHYKVNVLKFQELAQLELLCKQLYETSDAGLRSEAEKTLVQFANSPDCLSTCQLLLERGNVRTHQIIVESRWGDKDRPYERTDGM